MKKLFAAGTACTFAFSLALFSVPVRADESATTTNTDQSSVKDAKKGQITSSTSVTRTTKVSKTCTDQTGTTFSAGEGGYDKCMQFVKQHSKQMAGKTGMTAKKSSKTSSSSCGDKNQ